MEAVENFRITKAEEKEAFSKSTRLTNALTLADFVFGDPLIGIRDGKNTEFKLHYRPVVKSLKIFFNGKVLENQYYNYYDKAGLQFKAAPMYGDDLYADYISICDEGNQP